MDALKKKSLPCSWEGFFAVRESRYEGFDKVESLGKGGGVGEGNLSPERFPSPTFLLSLSLSLSLPLLLHRNRGERVEGRAVYEAAADREIDERVALGVPDAGNAGGLEKDRGRFTEHVGLLGELGGDFDRADLTARNGEVGRIFGKPKRTGNTAGFGLADVAGHSRNVGIVEGRNADFVIGSEQLPFRGDAAHIGIVGVGEGREEQGTEQGKAGVWLEHGFSFRG